MIFCFPFSFLFLLFLNYIHSFILTWVYYQWTCLCMCMCECARQAGTYKHLPILSSHERLVGCCVKFGRMCEFICHSAAAQVVIFSSISSMIIMAVCALFHRAAMGGNSEYAVFNLGRTTARATTWRESSPLLAGLPQCNNCVWQYHDIENKKCSFVAWMRCRGW